jgi:hypothetical protein
MHKNLNPSTETVYHFIVELAYFQNVRTYYPLGNTLHYIPVIFNYYVKLAGSTSSSHAICYP